MGRLATLVKCLVAAAVGYFVFGTADQLLALTAIVLTRGHTVVEWAIYAAGILLAVGTPFVAASLMRSSGKVPFLLRATLAGFAAFFCFQLIIGGVPDFSPFWVWPGFAVCASAAFAVIRVTQQPRCASVQGWPASVEQALQPDCGAGEVGSSREA